MKPVLRSPVYNKSTDGNVFDWILNAAQDYRIIRQRERFVELEKLQFLQREKAQNDDKRDKRI